MERVAFEELPADVQAELQRLFRLCELGRQLDAVAGLSAVVERFPGYTPGWFLLGRALRAKGELSRARQAFEAAAQVAPDEADVRMGLAWARLDAGDYVEALRLARSLLESATHRGDALAIQARAVEAAGDQREAARVFLEAYEAKPMIPWLEAHCRLVGIPFSLGARRTPPAWPVTPAQRLWLFRSVERDLIERAEAKALSLPPDRLLLAACDHTVRFTRRWAMVANIEVAQLYQALAGRGGFCDCEVLMNAAREDDDALESVLLSGAVEGGVAEVLDSLGDLLSAGEAARPSLSADTDEDERADCLLYESSDSGGVLTLRIGVHLVDGGLVGDLLDRLARAALPEAQVRLLLAYPDLGALAEVVTIRNGHVSCVHVAREGLPSADAARWVSEDLAAIRSIHPPSGPRTWSGRIGLPAMVPGPRLLLRDQEQGWVVADIQRGSIQSLEAMGSRLAIAPGGGRAAWLTPFRKIVDLVVEDVAKGERTRIERGRIDGPLSFSPDARLLYAGLEGQIAAFDLVTGERRAICSGFAATVSPDGTRLIVEGDGDFALWTESGSLLETIRGRSPVWSEDGKRVAFLTKLDGEGWQAFVFDIAKARAWRVSPPCEESCWPSFTANALTLSIRKARRKIPVAGDRVRLEEDEALVQCSLDAPGEVITLASSHGGYMRIVNPIAHPRLPLVAFRTQDAPQVGQRTVVVERGGSERTIVEGSFTPVAWLT